MPKKEIKKLLPKKNPVKPITKKRNIAGTILAIVFLVIITFLCFSDSLKNELTNWDDQQYIIENPLVKSLSFENIQEIFSTNVMGNYHPLAILSFAVDYHFYKLSPEGYHTTSLIIHLLNTILIFLFFRSLSNSLLVAFITALLFGIHPMHVESVAWVSERKDVLYLFFYMASLYTYLFFIKANNRKWFFYLLTFLLFALSLISKAQAVTLPLILLLIDYLVKRKYEKKLLIEKIPFLLLSIAMGIVAIIAQKETGAITDIPIFPLFDRILFASYGFFNYILMMVVPINLSAYYSYPVKVENLYPIIYYASPVFLLLIIFFIIRFLISNREFIFGFAFFILNIVLLLQLLPVGGSIMSDRYTYLSYVGLCFIIGNTFSKTWNSPIKKISSYKYFFAVVLLLFIYFLGYSTVLRNKIWRNSETLWTDVIRKNPKTVIAYGNRGSYYQKQGKLDIALNDFNKALSLKPNQIHALINRADIFRGNGQYDLSIADCNLAILTDSSYSGAYMNRGIAYCIVGRLDEAFNDFEKVISLDPKNANVYCNRGNLFDMKGQVDSAISNYSKAIFIKPEYSEAYYNRGKTYLRKGNYDSAISDFNLALQYKSNYYDVYFFRSQAYKAKSDYVNALNDALTVKRLGIPIDENYIIELQNVVKQ